MSTLDTTCIHKEPSETNITHAMADGQSATGESVEAAQEMDRKTDRHDGDSLEME